MHSAQLVPKDSPDVGVLFVNHAAQMGGAELSMVDHARHLGPDCTVLLFTDGPLRTKLQKLGVSVSVLDGAAGVVALARTTGVLRGLRTAGTIATTALAIARRMRTARITYANSQKAAVLTALAALIARRPMVWHLHDIMTAPDFSAANRRVVIALTNRAARLVIANSEATARAYRAVGGRRTVIVIPNGIDPAPFEQQSRQDARASVATEFALGAAPVYGVFGRICGWKGQAVAIAALAKSAEGHLLVVGGPLFGEEAQDAMLRDLAVRLGVEDRVHFCGFRQDIARLMASTDLVLHCSTEPEPFGRVIVEGMMAGVPVIATHGGGASEILAGSGAGRLVPPGDPQALAQAIESMMRDPALRADMSARGRAHARRDYTLDRVQQRLDAALAEWTAPRPPARVYRQGRDAPVRQLTPGGRSKVQDSPGVERTAQQIQQGNAVAAQTPGTIDPRFGV